VAGDATGALRVYDPEKAELTHELEGHPDYLVTISCFDSACPPYTPRILSLSEGGAPRIWDAELGVALHELAGHSQLLLTAAVQKGGRGLIATGWVPCLDDDSRRTPGSRRNLCAPPVLGIVEERAVPLLGTAPVCPKVRSPWLEGQSA
jgi:hypothetical protein